MWNSQSGLQRPEPLSYDLEVGPLRRLLPPAVDHALDDVLLAEVKVVEGRPRLGRFGRWVHQVVDGLCLGRYCVKAANLITWTTECAIVKKGFLLAAPNWVSQEVAT